MGFFFNHPVLDRLEKIMWEIAEEEVKTKLGSELFDSRKGSKELKIHFRSIFSEERKKAKMALNTYKDLTSTYISDALKKSLSESNPNWYSIEKKTITDNPILLAVPYEVLADHVAIKLDKLFSKRDEFANLLARSRMAFALEAVTELLKSEIKRSIKDKIKFKPNGFYPYDINIVDLIKNDYYRIGNSEVVSRIDMVIINSNAESDAWENVKSNVKERQQNKRFTDDACNKWSSI